MSDDSNHSIPGTPYTLTGRFLLDHDDYIKRRFTKLIIIHASDTPPSMNIGAETIRSWHVNERGWDDIGYNWVITRAGNWERGRPTWAVGAGARGYNDRAIHICMVGGRSEKDSKGKHHPEDNFSAEQKDSLAILIRTLKTGMDPGYPDAQVIGHRDVEPAKDCPCFDAKRWWLEEEAAIRNTLVG